MYYGEELGMRTTDPARIEDVHDPIGKLGWPKEKGRDGERTPMQWNATPNAGFTTGNPWLPVPPSAKTYNVETESKDPNSIFNAYKKLLGLRKTNEALRDGKQEDIAEKDPNVYAFLRRAGDKTVLVALNMSGKQQKLNLDWASHGIQASTLECLYASPQTKLDNTKAIEMAPFAALVADVK
jgi:alpha-glucosidase